MLKKITVLAMAVGIVAAMALPSTASAAWKHHVNPIQQNVSVGFTGTVGFQSELGRIHCQVTSKVTFFGPGSQSTTGAAESFDVHPGTPTENCTTGGGLAFCQVHVVNPTFGANKWVLHTTGTGTNPTVQVTFEEIHGEMTGGFCPFKHVTLTGGNAVFTPNPANGNTVTSATLSGTSQAHLYNTTPPSQDGSNQTTTTTQLTGTLNVEAPNSGTYSI